MEMWADGADASWITKYFDEVGDPKALINLGVGEPDFDLFEPLKEEAERVIRLGLNKYTQTAGIIGLREAIAEAYSRRWGVDISPDNVVVTPGASNALFMTLASIVRQEEEVVIPTPSFPSFKSLTRIVGGRPLEIESTHEQGFKLNMEGLRMALKESKSAVIINSPTNPTGTVIDAKALSEVVELCKKSDAYLISDEVYERFVYGVDYVSAARHWGEYDKIVIINSFSKTLAMTGWRLGYMIVPEHLKPRIILLQANINACAPSVAQHVALYALKSDEVQTMIDEKVSEYMKRRDIFCEALNSRGIPTHLPAGGIYLFPRIPVSMDSETFCSRLSKEAEVVSVPGRAFGKGGEGHFRVTFSAEPARLVEAAERMASFLERVKGAG
ncbi:MAG: pyridoxal phosphate-dependent aminotransferase [Nitrososphaerota archaeon]|nr:pyridoxal phosphate-dependent aminotransferase [Candidatus Calditenuaceae archaeon]MDW8073363.1 pyridoxal phosphate-dependent aminotransferase [Nitrososphaerota archaeon]